MNDVDDLITRYLKGELSLAETERLNQWLAEDERHLRYFFRRKNLEEVWHPAFPPSAIATERALRRVCPAAGRRRILTLWRNAAAVVILFIATATLVFRWYTTPAPAPQPLSQPVTGSFAHTSAAVLVLPSGEEILLDGQSRQNIGDHHNTVAQVENSSLRYKAADSIREQQIYHELRVPRGGAFSLILGDGSRLWINADSKVRYPVCFAAGERKIFVEGEIYLEVARDTISPFRVVTPRCEVTVLGTCFNMEAYPEETSTRVTLAGGGVRVTSSEGEGSIRLVPGEQAVVRHTDGRIMKRNVDPDLYCSWHEGRLVFRNNSLEDILRRISRWYDVEISWQDETLKNITFSGELKRYDHVGKLLDQIAQTHEVKFITEGQNIVVTIP